MLLAARQVAKYTDEISEAAFHESSLRQDAIVRKLEVIGEAARHVTDSTRSEHPSIEWEKITGMRHRLAHDYRNVDLDIVWSVATQEIPPLIAYLERVVPPDVDA